ncbi:glutathione S-transferase [soil metagenome]
MITVHHLDHSRSQRLLWLLEELALDYEVVAYQRDRTTLRAPASLRAIHPLGKAPVVVDGDIVLAESGAIIDDLVERYDAAEIGPPADADARRRYRYYLHYAEGSMMPLLLMALVFNRMPRAPMPFFARPIARRLAAGAHRLMVASQLDLHYAFLEGELACRPWFAGDAFTAADIQMSFPLQAAAARAGLDARYPALQSWLARILERSAYQRALARGGNDDVLT